MATSTLIFLAVVKVYDISGASEVTLYLSDRPFTSASGDTPAHTAFDQRILQPASLTRNLFSGSKMTGRAKADAGDLVLANHDGGLDYLVDDAFAGRDVTIYHGPADGAFPGGFEELFVGTINRVEVGVETLTLKLQSRQAEVDLRLQDELYDGDNSLPAGLEGTADDLEGKPKPWAFGKVENVPAVLVNSAKLIYQVADDEVEDIPDVYDRGVSLATPLQFTEENSGLTFVSYTGIAYGEGLWVMVGPDEKIYTSPDAETWTERSPPSWSFTLANDDFIALHYHDGLFVVVGQDGMLASSTDGITWTERTSQFGTDIIRDVTYDARTGLWIAVGDNGKISTSPDGETWTARTSDMGTTTIRGVAAGVTEIVAIGNNGEAATSSDGTTWTEAAEGLGTTNYFGIAYGRGKYVAIAETGGVAISTDGVAWTTRDRSFMGLEDAGVVPLNDITYDDGRFFVTGRDGYIATSPDAIAFNIHDNPALEFGSAVSLSRAAFNDGTWVVSSNGAALKSEAVSTFSDLTDLEDDDLAPPAGTYKWVSTASGSYFRLGAPPDGLITADVEQGANAAARTAAEAFKAVLTKMGMTSADWVAADLTALDSDKSYELGFWAGTSVVQASEVLDMIAASVNYWWGLDREGKFRILPIFDPDGESTDEDVIADEILGIPRPIPADHPVWRVVVRHTKNYAVQESDVAAGVTEARRGFLSQQWRESTDNDTSVQTKHPLAREITVDTLLQSATDAAAEATERLGIWGELRRPFEMDVGFTHSEADTARILAIELGEVVGVTHPRLGLSGGHECLVVGVAPNIQDKRVRLRMWR